MLKILCLLLSLCGLSLGACAADKAHTALPNVTVLAAPFDMPGMGRQRRIRVYVPPGYATSNQRYGVLYMHDGQNLFDEFTSYAGEWGVDETMDELAKSGQLELIVVGIDNGAEKRMTELNPWDQPRFGKGEGREYMSFVVNVIKPYIDQHYRTRPEREHTAVMGSSMGGLISHYAMQQYPKVFSKAGIFSPAYSVGPAMFDLARQPLPADARLYFYMGGQEGVDMNADVKKMAALVAGTSVPKENVMLNIRVDAQHNESAWRAEFKQAVLWLFRP